VRRSSPVTHRHKISPNGAFWVTWRDAGGESRDAADGAPLGGWPSALRPASPLPFAPPPPSLLSFSRFCPPPPRTPVPRSATSRNDGNGALIRPFHPFTRESQESVTPNDPALYRIEIYPTSAIFRKGDRIRLTIGSADTPATSPSLPVLADSLGGEIRVLHGGRYASHVLLPVAPG
jgi:hypothetical protein